MNYPHCQGRDTSDPSCQRQGSWCMSLLSKRSVVSLPSAGRVLTLQDGLPCLSWQTDPEALQYISFSWRKKDQLWPWTLSILNTKSPTRFVEESQMSKSLILVCGRLFNSKHSEEMGLLATNFLYPSDIRTQKQNPALWTWCNVDWYCVLLSYEDCEEPNT